LIALMAQRSKWGKCSRNRQGTPRPRWDPSPDILSEGAGSVEQYPVISPVNIFLCAAPTLILNA
jgi:hypothetical protein